MLGKRAYSSVTASPSTPSTKRKASAIDTSVPRARKRQCFHAKHSRRSSCPASFDDNLPDHPRSPKLRRVRSLGCFSPRPRLTQENLRLLEDRTSPTFVMSLARNPSPTRRDTAIADKRQLAGYNITVDKGIELPSALADFVKTLQQDREQEPSPHAQAITDMRRAASVENEISARRMMEEHILFRGEGYPDGTKYLALKDQVNLIRDYLPKPPRVTVPDLWGSLVRPQPDSCIGYITATEATAHTPAFAMPFTRLEDDMADWFNVVHNADTHFPFLTAQWKAAISGENQVHASLQAARDGALIVNYMHYFYSLAYPNRPPTQLETCHFSITTEGYTIIYWIHWREVAEDGEVYTRMEQVEMARMSKLDDLLELRLMLHNYLDFALGERLASIKTALPAFWKNRPEKKMRRTKSLASTLASGSELRLDVPMTPSSSVGESASGPPSPSKITKRKLVDLSQ